VGKKLLLSAAAAAALASGAGSANAVTISQPVDSYDQPSLCGATTGGCQTVYWGETFTAAITGQLTDLQFKLGPSSDLGSLYATVYAWNGTKITGSALWTSANVAGNPGLLDFTPTGVNLTSGQTYVALLGTYGISGNTGSATVGSCSAFSTCTSTVSDPYLGYAVYGNLLSGNVEWSKTTNNYADLTFSATITPVPEAATWAMMLAGFAAVGGAMRRRRTVVSFA
jgi:hypothetical protein